MMQLYLFGATGDLSLKKIFPALFALFMGRKIDESFEIICVGRRGFSQGDFHTYIEDHIKGIDDTLEWTSFLKHLYYQKMTFESAVDYEVMSKLHALDKTAVRLFYLATAPEYFEVIVERLSNSGILEMYNKDHRLLIEKPFGKDLESAIRITQHLEKYLAEFQIFRVDHYLGKEMIQNIMLLRFSNGLFEAGWNSDFIDYVQITVAESIGVFERAGYYDKSGAVRDMIQSHLLQILALLAMTPLCETNASDLCDAKVDVLKHLKFEDVKRDVVLGQYSEGEDSVSYRQEQGVHPRSNTETFAALRVKVDLPRWQGVDFYLRTGKRLKEKRSDIVIVYKKPTGKIGQDAPPNILTIQIYPQEGMTLQFNMKQPKTSKKLITREMAFCQSCLIDYAILEAYETLLYEAIQGNHDLYARWDEVKYEWTFIEKILGQCQGLTDQLEFYEPGEEGPVGAEALMSRDGRKWWSGKSWSGKS